MPEAGRGSGQIAGEAAKMADLKAGKAVLPDVPVLANTGVKHGTVAEVLRIADGCVVGSALKVGGDTWKPVDPERARDFMERVRDALVAERQRLYQALEEQVPYLQPFPSHSNFVLCKVSAARLSSLVCSHRPTPGAVPFWGVLAVVSACTRPLLPLLGPYSQLPFTQCC